MADLAASRYGTPRTPTNMNIDDKKCTDKPVYNDHPYQHEKWSLITGGHLIQVAINTGSTVESNVC